MPSPKPLIITALALAEAVLTSCDRSHRAGAPPASLDWAYPKAGASAVLDPLQKGPQRVPGSPLTFTLEQVNDELNPVDWFPDEHPQAPGIVAHGHKGGPTPCAECHLMNGQGFLGAANINGLPAAYIVEQVHAFKSGERRSAQSDHFDTLEMVKVAQQVSEADLTAAAGYFANLSRLRWVRMVETDTVPATRPDHYGWLDLVPGGPPEPIAGRIIEVPEDTVRMFRSDPHVGIVDYVPMGAVERGRALVRSGGPAGQACAGCHGAELRGTEVAPPLAGRAPTYLARMLWDIKTGARHGGAVSQMQGPAGGLSPAQITDIVAYLGSLPP
jgi:cytochrome c553